jgi:hypothetical protein
LFNQVAPQNNVLFEKLIVPQLVQNSRFSQQCCRASKSSGIYAALLGKYLLMWQRIASPSSSGSSTRRRLAMWEVQVNYIDMVGKGRKRTECSDSQLVW